VVVAGVVCVVTVAGSVAQPESNARAVLAKHDRINVFISYCVIGGLLSNR
jgi:hypothetical protein